MSIGEDMQRIKGNITAALAAIADKGVTVPDGSNSDALAGLIQAIEAGGGGLDKIITESFKLILSGSFTPVTTGTVSVLDSLTDLDLKELGYDVSIRELKEAFGICFCPSIPDTMETGYIIVPSYNNSQRAYRTKISNGSLSGSESSSDLSTYNNKLIWKLWSMISGVTYYWIMFAR